MDFPLISVIIPCRNEERYIAKCLDSVIAQDYPAEKLEIMVMDGMSDDGTRDIIGRYSARYSSIKGMDNPEKIVSSAMNAGIREAHGEIILRMDAHNSYEKNYVSKCLQYLNEFGADNAGGICMTLPGADTLMARSIALALSHPFGVGNSHFRIGSRVPRFVDTVPFGCYRREVFEKIGLFDEELVRNQDDELNLRLIRNGGKILLAPDVVSYYYARDTLLKLWKMYYQYGYFKPLVAMKVGGIMTWRQLIPSIFVGSLFASMAASFFFRPFLGIFCIISFLYLLSNLFFSFAIALKKGLRFLPLLPRVFLIIHLSYGAGYLKGIWDFIFLKKHLRKRQDVPLTR